ncbi:uncharacterized protein B0T15DRAFT_529745 [Chaetomium strumarium]|uniref:Uncharacterized protein n=1 Tax=Chaetomium strumarium TaxID=1170767 RepID=A0AAJ0GW77_9PEZI|nr:hypothetical protein B0T15DRAFT_529745 [Chaetomium strumarium]
MVLLFHLVLLSSSLTITLYTIYCSLSLSFNISYSEMDLLGIPIHLSPCLHGSLTVTSNNLSRNLDCPSAAGS